MNRFAKIGWMSGVIIVTAVLLFTIFHVEKKMDSDIKTQHLRFGGSVQDASPLVSFTTVALGSFRGLLADMLWIRAGKLQENNNFFEMVQLARWMTDLQPEFSGAAAYLAWNMAYNISAACSFHEDRWRWVNEGIKLMRDRAIVYNPEDPVRYKELAWIFQHKLGFIMDNSQQYYKVQLALDMMRAVTPNPQWDKIAAAPASMAEFKKKYGSNGPFQKAARAAGFEDLEKVYAVFRETGDLPETIVKALHNEEREKALDFFFRRRLLVELYKLNPNIIVEINNKYGELDWRLPEAQAIYWATMGVKKTPKGVESTECDRIILQTLPEAFRAGRLVFLDTKNKDRIMIAPNLNLIDTALQAYDEADQRVGDDTFVSSRRGFVKYAAMVLYCFGKKAKAEKYFKIARKLDPGIPRDMSLEAFVKREINQELKMISQKRLMALLSGMLFRSFDCRISGDAEAADSNELMAQYIYTKYQKDCYHAKRVLLPPYTQIRKSLLDEYCEGVQPKYAAILQEYYKTVPQKEPDGSVHRADAPSIGQELTTQRATDEKK